MHPTEASRSSGFSVDPTDMLTSSMSHEEDPVKDFVKVEAADQDERRQIEYYCQAFIKDNLQDIAYLFAEFVPKTIKANQLAQKFPDLLKKVEYWHPLCDFPLQQREEEIVEIGEQWLQSTGIVKEELSKVNQDLNGKITAFTDTQPAFKGTKKTCNQLHRLYHDKIKQTLSELEEKYESIQKEVIARIEITPSSLTEKEIVYLTKIFDISQEGIRSHLDRLSKTTPQFLEKKEKLSQQWKGIQQEEINFKNNYDLFCFITTRNYYLKSLQKTDFWLWRNSYRFIEETTIPFSSDSGKKKQRNNISIVSIPQLSTIIMPDSSSRHSPSKLETVRLSTTKREKEETQREELIEEEATEEVTEEISEEEKRQWEIDKYKKLFENENNLELAKQLCIALALKVRAQADQYLFYRIKALVSLSSLPKLPHALGDHQLSTGAEELCTSIQKLSTHFDERAKKLEDILSNKQLSTKEMTSQHVENLCKNVLQYKKDYEDQSSTLITLSKTKNECTQNLEKRIKWDDQIVFSSQASRFLSAIYSLTEEQLREHQKNYRHSTRSFKDKTKKIKEHFDKMNTTLCAFKYKFELVCHKINTNFSKAFWTQMGINFSRWWNGDQFINQEELIVKKDDASNVLIEEKVEKKEVEKEEDPALFLAQEAPQQGEEGEIEEGEMIT